MRIPVTVADQGVFVGPDDVDELVDLLTDAATVIGHLAGHPAAETALAEDGSGPQQDCTELTLDLRLAAARLDEDTTARRNDLGTAVSPGRADLRVQPGLTEQTIMTQLSHGSSRVLVMTFSGTSCGWRDDSGSGCALVTYAATWRTNSSRRVIQGRSCRTPGQ
jgi:hypothetical protein